MVLKRSSIITRTDEIIKNGDKAREKWVAVYAAALRYVLGDQTAGKAREGGFKKININKIYPAIMQAIAMSANRDTDITVLPASVTDYSGANKWSGYLQWLYEKGVDMDMIRRECILSGSYFGRYIAKPFWDHKAKWDDDNKEWQGALKVRVCKPEDVVVDVNLESEHIEDAEYIYIVKRMPLREAIRLYPKSEKKLRNAASSDVDKLGNNISAIDKARSGIRDLTNRLLNNFQKSKDPGVREPSSTELLLDALDSTDNSADYNAYSHKDAPSYVTIYEMYLKDDEMTKITDTEAIPLGEFGAAVSEDADGVRIVDSKRMKELGVEGARKGQLLDEDNWPNKVVNEREEPKYPFGRLVIRCNGAVLNSEYKDQRIPYKSGWPLRIGSHLPLPFSPHGLNGVELARHLQDWLNAVGSSIAANAAWTANPMWGVEKGALQNDPENSRIASEINLAPSGVINLAPDAIANNKIKIFNPPSMSNDASQFFNMISSEMGDVLNSQNVLRGKASTGEQTGTEIATLSKNAAQQLDLAGRLLDKFTVNLCEACLEISKYHLNVGDVVRVIGDQFVEELELPSGEVVKFPQRKQILEELDFKADFDLETEITEHSPFSKEARKQDAMVLMSQLGSMSPFIVERFLKEHNVKDVERVMSEIARFMQAQEEEQQALAEAEQAKENNNGKVEGQEGQQSANQSGTGA